MPRRALHTPLHAVAGMTSAGVFIANTYVYVHVVSIRVPVQLQGLDQHLPDTPVANLSPPVQVF